MSSFAKLYASMENEMEDAEVGEVTTDDVIEAQAATDEVAQAEAEVVEVQDAIETGVADAETLDTVADTLEETIEDGGADPATAQMAEVAVESIYKRLGIKMQAMPALESFNSHENRIKATQLAIEGIKETAKKVWDTIVSFFKNLWNKIKDYFSKFLGLFGQYEGTINRLLKEVKVASDKRTLKGGVVKEILGKFDTTSYTKFSDYTTGIKNIVELYSTYYAFAGEVEEQLKVIINNKGANSLAITKFIIDKFSPENVSSDDIKGKIGLDKNKKPIYQYLKSTIIGNTALCFGIQVGEEDKIPDIKVTTVKHGEKASGDATLDVTKTEMIDALNTALSIVRAQKSVNISKLIAASNHNLDTAKKELDKQISTASKQDDNVEQVKALKDSRKILIKYYTFLTGLITNIAGYSNKHVKVIINAGMQYKNTADKKEEKPAEGTGTEGQQ